ncbi:MAG: hypothetical protein V2A58_17300 [Planctomycetota bacterium]
MDRIAIEGKTISFELSREGRRWVASIRRRDLAPAGTLDLCRDLYGWMRADGYAPGKVRRVRVETEEGATVRISAEVFDKNLCVWDMTSTFEIVERAGVEFILERRLAFLSDVRYDSTSTMKGRDCILATRVTTTLPTRSGEFIMVPSSVYGTNKPADTSRCLMIYDPSRRSFDFATGRSPYWFLASDRTSLPMVLAMSESKGMACGVLPGSVRRSPEHPGDGETFADAGIGFDGRRRTLELFLTAPYYELPASFAYLNFAPARVRSFIAFPGDRIEAAFVYAPLPAGRHAYAAVLQGVYDFCDADFPANPWMDIAEANSLQAEALHRYHFVPDKRIVRAHAHPSGEPADDTMMLGWCAGLSSVAGILLPGIDGNERRWIEAGVSVLDRIASDAPTPSGLLADRFDGERFVPVMGERGINVRVLCEALWIWMHLVEVCEKRSIAPTEPWRTAIRASVLPLRDHQAGDGELGFSLDPETGEFAQRGTSSSFMAIAALARGASFLSDPSLLEAASRAGRFYRRYLEDEILFGATLDTGSAINSEDGYNALLAYMELLEATGEKEWLRCAERACDWFLTFRWGYNQRYPKGSLLDRFDFRSKGMDTANVPNQHLHTYGTLCLTEQVQLWLHTGNPHYLRRAADLVSAGTQMIPRRDDEILNLRRGMHVEQYYNSNWASQGADKGDIDPRHISWVPGLCVFGDWRLKETFGGLVVSPRHRQACGLDACEVTRVAFTPSGASLTVRNLLDRQRRIPVVVCHLDRGRSVAEAHETTDRGDARLTLALAPRGEAELTIRLR